MPNKRDKNKRGVSLFIPEEQRNEWKKEADKQGLNLKDYLVSLIEKARKEKQRNGKFKSQSK